MTSKPHGKSTAGSILTSAFAGRQGMGSRCGPLLSLPVSAWPWPAGIFLRSASWAPRRSSSSNSALTFFGSATRLARFDLGGILMLSPGSDRHHAALGCSCMWAGEHTAWYSFSGDAKGRPGLVMAPLDCDRASSSKSFLPDWTSGREVRISRPALICFIVQRAPAWP